MGVEAEESDLQGCSLPLPPRGTHVLCQGGVLLQELHHTVCQLRGGGDWGEKEDWGQEGTVTARQMFAPLPSLPHSPSIYRLTI